jgi:hypothetical protein
MSVVVKIIVKPKEEKNEESQIIVDQRVYDLIGLLTDEILQEKEYESELAAAFSDDPKAKLKKKPKKPPIVEPVKQEKVSRK